MWIFGHVHERRGGVWLDLSEAAAKVLRALRLHHREEEGGDTDEAPTNSQQEQEQEQEVARVQQRTLFLNASNANDGRATSWPRDRPPMLVRINLRD